MVTINYANKNINCKIVYFGIEKSGKTTNLKYIQDNLEDNIRTPLTCLTDESNSTLFFDHMFLNAGEAKGFQINYNLYGASGKADYKISREMILKETDGIIFIVDSQKSSLDENILYLKEVESIINQGSSKKNNIPVVLQYNKRDLNDIIELDVLERELNKNSYPFNEAVAKEGTGVFASLKMISDLILTNLQ